MPKLTMDYILQRCQADPITQCWNWLTGTGHFGYGVICQNTGNYKQKTSQAHRVSYELTYGPTTLHVLHKCNNPKCVNPKHLYAGTPKDNYADQVIAGTNIRGTKCHFAKLQEQDILAIRAASTAASVLAAQYNCTPSTIHKIRKNKIWKHLDNSNQKLSVPVF